MGRGCCLTVDEANPIFMELTNIDKRLPGGREEREEGESMRARRYQGMRKVVLGVAALVFAVALAGCQGALEETAASHENATSQPELAQDFGVFWKAMDELPTNYTYEYREDYVLGDEGTGKKGLIHYTAQADGMGEGRREHIVYADDDTLSPGVELYQEGATLIRIDGGTPVDVSVSQQRLGESDELDAFASIGFLYAQENFVEVTKEGGDTVYHFAFGKGGTDEGYGMVGTVTSAEESCRFNAEGALVEEVLHLEGFAEVDGGQAPVTSTVTIRYSQWATTDVPVAPAPEANQVKIELPAAIETVSGSIQGLPANFSCQTETSTTVTAAGQTQSSELYVEALLDRSQGVTGATYVEVDGNEDDAVTTYFGGDRVVVVQHDEIVSDEQSGAPSDPMGTERVLSLVEAVKTIDAYEYGDGLREYVLDVDVAKLNADAFDGIESLSELVAHCYIDAEGNLNSVAMQIGGVPSGAGADAVMEMSISTVYYDLGTTEVPALP